MKSRTVDQRIETIEPNISSAIAKDPELGLARRFSRLVCAADVQGLEMLAVGIGETERRNVDPSNSAFPPARQALLEAPEIFLHPCVADNCRPSAWLQLADLRRLAYSRMMPAILEHRA